MLNTLIQKAMDKPRVLGEWTYIFLMTELSIKYAEAFIRTDGNQIVFAIYSYYDSEEDRNVYEKCNFTELMKIFNNTNYITIENTFKCL